LLSGRYKDANEVVETALHALADDLPYTRAELEEMIQEGIDSADRGELYTEEEARALLAAERAKL
jgi:Arc/MetJ-type ribon-helix-helix transcriptional regulator